MNFVLVILAILWASPATLLGLFVGALGLLTGGRARRHGRVLEFHGGAVTWFLRWFPLVAGAAAITFGHTVLARTRDDLEWTRDHERVHVGQYERWGPFFIPAYLLCSLVLWLRGRDSYLDNPFERQAYRRRVDSNSLRTAGKTL